MKGGTANYGITRDLAEQMLALGWTKAEILDLSQFFKSYCFEVHVVYSWGLLVKQADQFVWYRGVPNDLNCLNRIASLPSTAIAYADGSGTTSSKPAGIGVYAEDGDRRLFISKNIGCGTNNVAELTAIWEALRQFPLLNKKIHVLSDSEYAIGSLTQDWAPVANIQLIRAIREDLALRCGAVSFEHVDGHSGVEGNEIADSLAKIGRKLVKTETKYPGV